MYWHHSTCLLLQGSTEKREYLQARFPQLDADSFASSRSTTFEQHILRVTNGKGKFKEYFSFFSQLYHIMQLHFLKTK